MNKLLTIAIVLILALGVDFSFAKNDKKNNSKSLPPGLEMNAARGKALPPGWQKKMVAGSILDKEVFDHGKITVPIDDKGYITFELEGRAVRLVKATREIVDVLK